MNMLFRLQSVVSHFPFKKFFDSIRRTLINMVLNNLDAFVKKVMIFYLFFSSGQ